MPSPKKVEVRAAIAGRRAVFLDRDGVLNRNVFYADTGAYESPRSADELVLMPGVVSALIAMRAAGFLLILVSNQPNAAKGKCSREVLDQIHARLATLLEDGGVALDAVCYCYHHPAHSGPCLCRKPGAYFLLESARRFGLDLRACWMIGDRATDIACGRSAGVSTLWMHTPEENPTRAEGALADGCVRSLSEAASRVLAAASSLSPA